MVPFPVTGKAHSGLCFFFRKDGEQFLLFESPGFPDPGQPFVAQIGFPSGGNHTVIVVEFQLQAEPLESSRLHHRIQPVRRRIEEKAIIHPTGGTGRPIAKGENVAFLGDDGIVVPVIT